MAAHHGNKTLLDLDFLFLRYVHPLRDQHRDAVRGTKAATAAESRLGLFDAADGGAILLSRSAGTIV